MTHLSEEEFNEVRAYTDYPTYQADNLVVTPAPSRVFTDDQLVAAVKEQLRPVELREFTDETLASYVQYHVQHASRRATVVRNTVAQVRDRLQRRRDGTPSEDDPKGWAARPQPEPSEEPPEPSGA